MQQQIILLQQQAEKQIAETNDTRMLEDIRVEYLGKKGLLTDILKGLSQLPADQKPLVGQWINDAKRCISDSIQQKKQKLQAIALQEKLASEQIDITLPGRHNDAGTIHPVTQVKQRVIEFFSRSGFDIVSGPEIESEFYNFEALNIPEHHPARAMHDTFYFGDGLLLRTHTSPVQIRTMEEREPPLRLIAPGRVYRCDSDMTHSPMFHQVEGLVIDKQVTMANLRGLLHDFFADFFNTNLSLRFRPSYFPFTEPSAEVDIACTQCKGKGCRSCKMTGWLEVLGCGMVHPNVLKAVNISPDEFQGFAFGIGLDRLAMLYFGIDDLRLLFENDVAFVRQF